MGLIEAIVLGILQGITEFLPVSSSGHLAVLHYFMGVSPDNLTFDIAVHIGTALSVVVVYKKILAKIICDSIKALKSKKANPGSRLAVLVVIGSIPAGVVGVFFKDSIEQVFSNLYVVICGFVFTGFILFLTRNKRSNSSNFLAFDENTNISTKQAVIVGISQAVAILPGISRSGSTIATGVLGGLNHKDAAMFSFLLALPAIFGAGLLQIKDLEGFNMQQLQILLIGLFTSFVVGFFALKLLLRFVQKGRVHLFSYYVWALAAILLIFKFMEH